MQSDRITGLTLNGSIAKDSGSSDASAIGPPGPDEEFTSFEAARAYLCSIRSSIGNFGSADFATALSCAGRAYQQFPELILECPSDDFLDPLASTAVDPDAQTLASVI